MNNKVYRGSIQDAIKMFKDVIDDNMAESLNEDWSRGVSLIFKVSTEDLKEACKSGAIRVGDLDKYSNNNFERRFNDFIGRNSLIFRFTDSYDTSGWVNIINRNQSDIHFNWYDDDFTYKEFGGKAKFNRAQLTPELKELANKYMEKLQRAGISVNSYKVEVGGSPRFNSSWRQAQDYNESLNEDRKTDEFFVRDNDSGYMYHGIDEVIETIKYRINKNIFPIIIDKVEDTSVGESINEAPDLSRKKGTSTNVLTQNDSWKNCTSVNDLYNTIKKLFDENNLHSVSNNTLLNKIKLKKNLADALMLVYNSILKGSGLGVTEDIDSQYRNIKIVNTIDATQAAELQGVRDTRKASEDNMKEKNKETAEFIDNEGKKYVTEKLHLNEDSDIDESCNKKRKKRGLKEMATEKRDMWTEIYDYLARVKYEGKHGKELTAFRQGFVGYDNIYVVNDIDIGISVPKEEDLDYAKRVAEKFNLEYEVKAPTLTHKNYEMIIYIPEEYVNDIE